MRTEQLQNPWSCTLSARILRCSLIDQQVSHNGSCEMISRHCARFCNKGCQVKTTTENHTLNQELQVVDLVLMLILPDLAQGAAEECKNLGENELITKQLHGPFARNSSLPTIVYISKTWILNATWLLPHLSVFNHPIALWTIVIVVQK